MREMDKLSKGTTAGMQYTREEDTGEYSPWMKKVYGIF